MKRGIEPHPDFDRLRDRMAACREAHAVPFEGIVFQSAPPKHCDAQSLTAGEGCCRKAGRWNPAGAFRAVYSSLDPITCMEEGFSDCHYHERPVEEGLPRVIVPMRARLAEVVDLRDGATRRMLRVSADAMLRDDWRAAEKKQRESLTQALGRAADEAGLHGLLVPSAQIGGSNLVIFVESLTTKQRLSVLRPQELKK